MQLFFILSCKEKKRFELLSSAHTGIHFQNTIIENDSVNVLDFSNIYNGGGVGIGDFNNDGLQDIYFTGNMGNLGGNSFYRAGNQRPVSIYAKDFDNNGGYDAIPTLFLKDTFGKFREYPAQGRDNMVEQLPVLKKNFLTYKDFAHADFHQMFPSDKLKDALTLQANNFKTCYIRNDGSKGFAIVPLPVQAQVSSVFGMLAEDVDGDGNLDLIINGNDYGTEVSTGRYDALNGLVMKGDGRGNFAAMSILESGLYIPGNGKALVKLRNEKGNCLISASQNKGPLKIFLLKQNTTQVSIGPFETYALLKMKNGRTRKVEFHFGEGFLSQSGRFLNIDGNIISADIVNNKGNRRTVIFHW
jgi:hypothetical protein